ncbi:MAG: hypothetical protein V1800_10080 [Candidatus Latescibacterota bacterium]
MDLALRGKTALVGGKGDTHLPGHWPGKARRRRSAHARRRMRSARPGTT